MTRERRRSPAMLAALAELDAARIIWTAADRAEPGSGDGLAAQVAAAIREVVTRHLAAQASKGTRGAGRGGVASLVRLSADKPETPESGPNTRVRDTRAREDGPVRTSRGQAGEGLRSWTR